MGHEPGSGVARIQIGLSQIRLKDKRQPGHDGMCSGLQFSRLLQSNHGRPRNISVIVNSFAKAGPPPENSPSGAQQYQPGYQDANF